jgi:hypothetical protein
VLEDGKSLLDFEAGTTNSLVLVKAFIGKAIETKHSSGVSHLC